MTDIEQMRERYIQDDLPTRLGGLAAYLMRVASSARGQPGPKHKKIKFNAHPFCNCKTMGG